MSGHERDWGQLPVTVPDAVAALETLSGDDVDLLAGHMAEADAFVFDADWESWVREGQSPPGERWRQWVMLAGRGFGKTRAGAEYVSEFARANPSAAIALVGATAEEARSVMVEGPSGLLAVARADERRRMQWKPSLRRLTFASGAQARLYSAANPESLRGPEHHLAWCDELAKWKRGEATWNNLRLGLRKGDAPRAIVTTTPRPVPLLKRLLADASTATSGGPSRANPHVSEDFIEAVEETHGGTRFGRQELEGVLLDDLQGALWTRELIERSRVGVGGGGDSHFSRGGGGVGDSHFSRGGDRSAAAARESDCPLSGGGDSHFSRGGDGSAAAVRESDCPLARESDCPLARESDCPFRRVVVGVDPPAGADGTCGIVVCGLDEAGIAYVLADCSVAGLGPEGWARKVAGAAEGWRAHRVIAEANNGGKMVETVLRGASAGLPVTLVHAADGKAARAEPVMVAFESGRVRLAGRFPELEDELAGLIYGGGYAGPGASPDRADAMVWAVTELVVKPQRAPPRIRRL